MSPTYKSPEIHLLPTRDFASGLNLRADAFQLQDGESPDMLNVDIDAAGGFGLRKGVGTFNGTALSSQPKNIWMWSKPGSTAQVVVQEGSGFKHATSASPTFSALVNPGTRVVNGRMQAAMHSDMLYIMRNRETFAARWDGASGTELADAHGTYNDNLAAPAGGEMPKGRYIASHKGYLFIANTDEAGTAKPNRVRFSHPNQPEDWRTNDYIDVEVGVEGDEIVGLQALQDKLLVFKQNSVHAITGFSPDTFSVTTLTNSGGAPSQQAICAHESGVFWFSWPHGIMHFDGRNVTWMWERLKPAIDDGDIPQAEQADICIAWLNRRLWVSVPFDGATDNTRVFVFNPAVGQQGAWMAYSLKLGPMIEWQPPGSSILNLACSRDTSTHRVFKLEQSTAYDIFDGSTQTQITSYYYTRWLDPTDHAQRKRFRRPQFVVDADDTATLTVKVFKDYDPTVIKRQFTLVISAISDTLDWGEDWGLPWSGDVSTGAQRLMRGLGVGNARALQFKVEGPTTKAKWAVNAISIPFLPKRVR